MSRNHPLRIALALFVGLALSLTFAACEADDSPAPVPAPAPAPAPEPAPEPDHDHDHEHAVYLLEEYVAQISSSETLQLLQGAEPFPEGVTTAPHIAFFAHPMDEPLWEPGGMASPGLKTLAETGDASELNDEAEMAGYEILFSGSYEEVFAWIQMSFEGEATIEVEHDLPCFSYAQMIAPSPDWFIGFSNVCLVDENGEWLEDVELEAVAYDAGTAAGMEYALKAEGADTMEPITLLDVAPFSPAGTPVSTIHVHEVHE